MLGRAAPLLQGEHQAHGFLRKDFGQRLWQQHDHMAWPQPSLSVWILQESHVSEDVVRDGGRGRRWASRSPTDGG